jgi:hypothetical protein
MPRVITKIRSARAVRTAVIGLIGGTALAGCGIDTTREQNAVRRTLQRELVAIAEGDGATACALLTPNGRAIMRQGGQGHSCRWTVAYVSRFLPPDVKLGMHNAAIDKVIVSGAIGLVYDDHVHARQGNLQPLLNPGGAPNILVLQPDGTWQIDS